MSNTQLEKETVLSRLSWAFAKRYRVTLLFWIIVLIFGALGYVSYLKREGFPSINLPYAVIQGSYFVDSPERVDSEIVQSITVSLEDIDQVARYQTTAGPNFYSVVVEFQEDVSSQEGAKLLEEALSDDVVLPTGATATTRPIDAAKFANRYNLLLAVYSGTESSYEELQTRAAVAATELSNQADIQSAEVVPIIEEAVNPATGEQVQRQTAINKVGIREGSELVFYPAVSIGVTKTDSVDAIQLSDAVATTIEDLENRDTFEGVNLTITADFATTIDQQISSLQSNLLGGLVAVLLVALLLISWRAALVIALFIPTVMAGSFVGLTLLGFSLNTITLFALILTLGLFVDDATIIVEAIDAHRRDKGSHKQIIKAAVGRVGMASIAGTLTTILVFTPMLFVSGILGEFIRLLPVTVILALALSMIISLILVPFLARPLVIGRGRSGVLDRISLLVPVERRIAGFLAKLPLLREKSVKKAAMVNGMMVGISVAAIIGAGYLFSQLKFEIFPSSKDSNVLQVQVEFPPATPLPVAESTSQEIDRKVTASVAENLDYVTYEQGNERSLALEVGLTDYQEREATSGEIIDALEDAFTGFEGASIKVSQLDAGPPSEDFPFQMRVYGNNESVLRSAGTEVQQFLEGLSVETSSTQTAEVVEVSTDGIATISRSERGRFVTIGARYNSDGTNSAAVIETENAVKDRFTEAELQRLGLSRDALDFDVSQESENADSFSSIGTGLILALALMYLLLVILFNSFSQPLLIFVAIPFSLFGVAAGLKATDNPLSFFVMLGLLGLIGIVVNNSILLVEYANQEREQGADRHTAISRAVRDRFRPLVTTTSTTIVALIPLALSDPFWQPLAYTLIFGMASSTILIILAFPYYYLGFEYLRDRKNRKFPALK